MIVTLKNAEGTRCKVLSLEAVENGTIIKAVDIFDRRKTTTVEEYDETWEFDTVKVFFVTEINACIANGYKLVSIQQKQPTRGQIRPRVQIKKKHEKTNKKESCSRSRWSCNFEPIWHNGTRKV